MKRLKNFLVLCSVLLRVSVCGVFAEGSSLASAETSNLMSEVVSKFKLDFHHSLQSIRIRKKRQAGILEALNDENAFVKENLRVESYVSEDLSYLEDYNLTFWTSVFHQGKNGLLIGTANGELVLFELQNRIATTVARSFGEAVGNKAKAFSHHDEQWFAILHRGYKDSYIRLYTRVGRGIEQRQTILLEGDSDFDLVTVRGVHYLAVATYKAKTSQGYTYQANVALYHWTRTQFDAIATRTTYGARSLACWSLDGSLYLSVAQERDDYNLYLGSLVFMYNSKEERSLVQVETLNTKAPKKCAYFFVSGSHYLIFIGEFDAVIYWWAGNQFLEWQTIVGSASAVDVSVLSLIDGEAIIAIALKDKIQFLTLDVSGHYMLTYVKSFEGFSLSSLQFMWDRQDYFALALFEASLRAPPHPTWRLNLVTYKLLGESAMDSLLMCLHRVKDRLEERQTEIQNFNARADKVWLLNKEQEIAGNLIIKGSAVSENRPVKAEMIQIASTEAGIPHWTPTLTNQEIGRLSTMEATISSQAQTSMLKSTPQEIRGMKNFTGSVETRSFSVNSLPREFILNDIPISELVTKTLKIHGNQVFSGTLHVNGLAVETVEASLINGLNTNDFLLLNGEQVVSGRLEFSNVLATDVVLSPQGTLNSIKVDQFITRQGDQEIHGLKSFSSLKAEVVDVYGNTNGEDLEEISKKIITVDGGDIYGNIEFKTPVDVKGDILLLGLINRAVNLSYLIDQGVNKYSDQNITGPKTFMSQLSVKQFHTIGTVNGIDIDKDLISLAKDQDIFGDLTFTSHVTFEEDLHTGLVNGVDLNTEAVLKHDDQFIGGHKTFKSLLTADEIKMSERVTLDYVDPSELSKMLVQHQNGVINDTVVINSAVVLGDLIAEQGINNFAVKDLPDTTYLKSRPQEIKVPVVFPGPITAENLHVNLVNGLNLDTDVVHTFGDEAVLSKKHFMDGISVKNLSVQPGKLFGGVEISSFGNMDPLPDLDVGGIKILPFLHVQGNITVDSINGIDPSALMLTTKLQRISGRHTYETTTVLDDFQVSNVIPKVVNGINLKDFMSNAVLRSPGSREILNKNFTEIQASALHVPAGGQIDGVSIPEMILKAVTTNTPQYIDADKTFSGSLQFKKQVLATTVNGLDLVNHIHKVIFLDHKEAIRGKKTIHGDLHASDLIVHGLLNGVNLTRLSEAAFYKSRRNEITVPMAFLSDLDIESLIVEKPALIDGIQLDDLAMVHENTYIQSVELKTNVFIPGNMYVGGLVNGCNISKVFNEALKLRGNDHQVLSGEVELNSLNVNGSVIFRDTVSGIELEDLFEVVTRPGDHAIGGNFHFGSGIKAHSLHIEGPIEGIDLNYIIRDAVRKSLPQEITSFKHLKEDLEIRVLESTSLFATEKVNNVNLKELTNDIVWKHGFQVINGEKTFGSLHVNNATILGYLNGIRLPEDVVLAYTSDRILSPVHFMKNVVIQSNLTVNGKIDGVDLNTFLNRRVTLSEDEEISAELVFKKDLTVNNIFVDGTINDLVLEMTVQSNKHNKIEGIKQFNNLLVHGDVTAGLVNGYNLTELLNSLIRLDDRESLHGLQVFTQPLHLTSAVIEKVNGIELRDLEKAHLDASNKITAIENFFDSENKLQQDHIANQVEAALYQISDLAYLVQIQELNFGTSNKITFGHRIRSKGNLFYQYMVMWTTLTTCATPNKCCDSTFSYWLEADDDGYLTARQEPEVGRYFPVRGVNLFPTDSNFVMWTDTAVAQPTWCQSKIQETTEIASVESSPLKVFLALRNSPLLTDVRAFREGKLYIIAGYYADKRSGEYSRSVVYDYNDRLKEWKEYQLLPAHGVLAMDITSFKTDSAILLALGTGLGSYPDSELLLFKWNDTERTFLEMQRLPSDYVTSILWVDNKNTKLLVVSSVEYWSNSSECMEDISGGEVSIYEYYSYDLRWIQSIPLKGVVSVASFQTAGETFLAAASRQMETVYILRWKGFGKFWLIHSIYSPGVHHVNTYRRRNDLFMTVASASGKSAVLKAVVRGKTYYQRSEEEFPVELSDTPYSLESSQISC